MFRHQFNEIYRKSEEERVGAVSAGGGIVVKKLFVLLSDSADVKVMYVAEITFLFVLTPGAIKAH